MNNNVQDVPKRSELEYLGKYKFYRKVFQTKVIGFYLNTRSN